MVGLNGDIGLCVEEKDRSWCISSASNDHRAVTIEVASDTTDPYAVMDKAYAALLDLLTDICKRNGKSKLIWLGDKDKSLAYTPAAGEMLMTVHRWFANKACPGEYLYSRHAAIAAEVTKRLTPTGENKENDNMKIYKLLADVPSSYKDAVQKVVDKGALRGTGNGELNVSEDLCRTLTILDRLGKLD